MSSSQYKIAFDAKRAFFNQTGLGNYSRDLITALSKEHSQNHYYSFVPSNKPSKLFSLSTQSHTTIKGKSSYWRSYGCYNDINHLDVDLYHGLSNEIPFSLHKTSCRSVVTIHDLIFERYPHLFKFIDRKVYRYKFQKACANSDRVIAISKQTADDLMSLYNISSSKIEVIYQSCHENFQKDHCETKKLSVKKKYNLPDQFILSLGTIEERKNLLNVVKGIKQHKITTPLFVAGKETPYAQKVKDYIKENSIKNVTFLEYVDFEDLPSLYQLATTFVYCSIFEGFGIPVIEAQFSDTAVITSKVSCLPEAAGQGAILVDPLNPDEIGSSLKIVLNDLSLRDELIMKGKENRSKFTWKNCAHTTHDLYAKLIT